MKALFSIFKMRFKLVIQYRMSAVASVFTQLFFGFVMIMIFLAFFDSTKNTQYPMTLQQTITYIWLGQALLSILPWNGDREIQAMIRNGDFAYELVRPVDLYYFWFYRIVGQRIAGTLIRCIPLLGVVILFVPKDMSMSLPTSFGHFLMFIITLIFAIILGGTISNIITISVLFTIGDGIERMFPAFVTIFSGMTIPLSFFPDWSQTILRILPFSGLVDSPYKFYLGIYGASTFPIIIVHQLLWTLFFIVLGKWMILKAQLRTIVQGG